MIDVAANDPQDTETRDQIRGHLTHIAQMFADGNFNAPMLIHEQTPPGVPTMQKLKSEIKYTFEQTEHGARILIKTGNSEALAAVHDFLKFQIEDHKTGDSVDVKFQMSVGLELFTAEARRKRGVYAEMLR